MMHFFRKSGFQICNRIRSRNFHCSNSRFFSNQQQQNSHFEDVGSSSMASHLKTRFVIRFRGPDTIKFLQGLVTNDVRKFGGETSTLSTPNMLMPMLWMSSWIASTTPLVEANKETDELNYLQWRVEKGVAEGSTEIPKGEAIPLEYNLAGLNAISFNKGCYVGQESVARTHHRGVIRKRLLPLKFLDKSRNEVVGVSSDKKVGTFTTALGSHGMGLLRLEDAVKGSGSLSIKGQGDVKIKVIRPNWWPSEWFPDH
ncbi:hypothetical protein MKX03_004968 [Papaver bracteatum]|nr:hypothetical protein MKX03_004968 [Papaver bracteatum]